MRTQITALAALPFAAFAAEEVSPIYQTLTYTGLGMTALALAGWILWNIAKRNNNLDARVIALMHEAVKPYQDSLSRTDALLDEEREEKRRAQDERDKASEKLEKAGQKLVEIVTEITHRHDAAIQQMRTESLEAKERMQAQMQMSLERAHARVDECEKSHRIEAQALAAVQAELREVRDRLFQVAQASQPGTQPFPPTTPVVPVPAAGLTITPSPPPSR